MAVKIKNVYEFIGTVSSAEGFFRKKIIGGTVKGTIVIIAEKSDLEVVLKRVVRVSTWLTSFPKITLMFPGSDLQGVDYPYVVRNLNVVDQVLTPTAKITLTLKIEPWKKLKDIRAVCSPTSWISKFFMRNVTVDGAAELTKSESILGEPRKT
jgi:hypothetical protein